MDEKTIINCKLFLLSIINDEVVIPAKYMEQYLNIHNHQDECIENIFKLLNKETPVEPYHIENKTYCCMSCDVAFFMDAAPLMNESYCEACGQKFDWSDKNE